MIVEIELVVVLGVGLTVAFWFILYKLWKKRDLKYYNPENDKGRKAEESRSEGSREPSVRGFEGEGRESTAAVISVDGLGESKEPGVLPTAEIIVDGETSDSDGEVSKELRRTRFRNPFKRRNRK